MSKDKNSDPRYTGEEGKMVEYAERKYGQKFVAESYDGGGAYKNIQFPNTIMYPKGDLSKQFMVVKMKNQYKDGYAFRLVEPMVDQRIKNIVGNEFPDFKYATVITTNANPEYAEGNYTKKIDYNDFIKKEGVYGAYIEINAFVNCGNVFDKDKEAQEMLSFMKRIVDGKIVGSKIAIVGEFTFLDNKNFNRVDANKLKVVSDGKKLKKEYDVKMFAHLMLEDGQKYNVTIEDAKNDFYSD